MTLAWKKMAIVLTGVMILSGGGIAYQKLRRLPEHIVPVTVSTLSDLLDSSDAYVRRGEDHADFYAVAAAESIALVAVRLDSLDPDVLHRLARAQLALHKFDDVLFLQNYVLKLHPQNSMAWGIQGDAFQELGKYRSADSSYYAMYTFDQGFHSMLRIAREEFLLRDYDKALSFIDEGIEKGKGEELEPHELAAGYLQLGEMLLARGYLEPALRNVEYTLTLRPEWASALAVKVRLLRIQRRYGEAVNVCRRLVAISHHPRYTAMLARLYKDLDRQATADSLVQVAEAQFDTLARDFAERTRRDRVEFYLEWNLEPEKALRLASQESRKRRDPGAYSLLAWAYYRNGNYDLAWSSIALALRRGVQHPEFFYRAAVIAKAAGKLDKYQTFAKKLRDITPNFEEVYGPL